MQFGHKARDQDAVPSNDVFLEFETDCSVLTAVVNKDLEVSFFEICYSFHKKLSTFQFSE